MDHASPIAPSCSLCELLAKSELTPRTLHATSRNATVPVEIWLKGGQVLHARHGTTEGTTAMFAILDDAGFAFTVVDGREPPRRSITLSWGQLCHAARCALLDETPARTIETWLEIAVDDLVQSADAPGG